jgi:hypothetical protein
MCLHRECGAGTVGSDVVGITHKVHVQTEVCVADVESLVVEVFHVDNIADFSQVCAFKESAEEIDAIATYVSICYNLQDGVCK